MDDMNSGEGSADQMGTTPELGQAWLDLRVGLASQLADMTDEGDHLLVETPAGRGPGCTPYAQFATFDEGMMMRAELSGNAYLSVAYRLDADACGALRMMGWLGNDELEGNWYVERPLADAPVMAATVVGALREVFGVAHPQLLTYNAFGPHAETAGAIGLSATEDVPAELPSTGPEIPTSMAMVLTPTDASELRDMAVMALRAAVGEAPPVDDDGDIVLTHLGQPVWVRARGDQPAIEIFARVAHSVYSRRATAIEIAVLNRNHTWTKWVLRDREVWMQITLPALPFVTGHLVSMVDLFFTAMDDTRDDLALRVGGQVA